MASQTDKREFDISLVTAFRRKHGYLEWHFRPDCTKWPKHSYHLDRPTDNYPRHLICRRCMDLFLSDGQYPEAHGGANGE
jgi:hypothetical protein